MTTTYPFETNGLDLVGISHDDTDNSEDVYWTDPRLEAIIRIRLISDPGNWPWDVSYVLGRLEDGRQVHVKVPFFQLTRHRYLSEMVAAAKAEGVYLKGLCGGDIDAVVSRLW